MLSLLSVCVKQASPDTFLSVMAGLYFATSLFDKPKESLLRKLSAALQKRLSQANCNGKYALYANDSIEQEVKSYKEKVEDYHNGFFVWLCLASGTASLILLLTCHLYPWYCNFVMLSPLFWIIIQHICLYSTSSKSATKSIKEAISAQNVEERIEELKQRANEVLGNGQPKEHASDSASISTTVPRVNTDISPNYSANPPNG